MRFLLFLIGLILSVCVSATTYTSTQDGDYYTGSTWIGGSAPPSPIADGDDVIINHAVTFSAEIKPEGTANLTISSSGSLSGSAKIEFSGSGTVTINGNLTNTSAGQDTKFKGSTTVIISSSGSMNITRKIKVEGSASLTNSGEITTAKIEIKGDGSAVLGGDILVTDELKIKGDAIVSISGNIHIDDDFKLEDDANVTVDNGATVVVEDELKTQAGNTLTINGAVVAMDGKENKGTINGSGLLQVDGGFDNQGTINGSIDVCNSSQSSALTGGSVSGGATECSGGGANFPINEPDALPVTLTHFSSSIEDDKILLEWETASEINNNYFEIQYSSSSDFSSIGKVTGNGTVNTPKTYSFTHINPSAGYNYYRLKQVDFDGSFEYSTILSEYLAEEFKSQNKLTIYPNPSTNQISIIHPKAYVNNIRIYTIQGNEVVNYSIENQNNNALKIDVSSLSEGMYFIILDELTSSFIKQ